VARREFGVRCEEFADSSRAIDSHGFTVKETEAISGGACRIGESVAKDLHACTNGEHDCALVDSTMKSLAAVEFACGLDLWSVFAAAHEVEIGRIRNRCTSINSDVLNGDSAPLETA
jgi:hypothetical protein